MGLSRYLRFNAVGMAGFVVQLAVVWLLSKTASGFGGVWPAAAITILAVEAAILHNFLWHERWTWADRPVAGRARLARLARFHLTNGVVSIGGNLTVVLFLAPVALGSFGRTSWALLFANAIAVLTCSLVNFATGDRLVFSRHQSAMVNRSNVER